MKFAWCNCLMVGALVGVTLVLAGDEPEKPKEHARTDLIDKAVLAVKSSFMKSVNECTEECRTVRRKMLENMDFESAIMSAEAKELIEKLRADEEVGWGVVDGWLERAGEIQRTFFENVFHFYKGEPQEDALFYLDIGEKYKAAELLLSHQKELTRIVADYTAVLSAVQKGRRPGLASKLVSQLADLGPYHDTFGCIYSISSTEASSTSSSSDKTAEGTQDCSAVLRSTFKKSFLRLQDTVTKFYINEMSEDDVSIED